MERVCRLEGTVSVMEGELAVARNVNTLLSRQLDEASSYSRRSCMIFMGSPKVREWWNKWWWRFKRNIGEDRRKWFQEASRQNTSHRWCKKRKPTENYKIHYSYLRGESTSQHKPNKKNDNGKRKKNPKHKSQVRLNVRPSLSRNRIDLLGKANEAIEGDENFKFAYADMHGNLKFALNKPLNWKYFKHFRNEEGIINIRSAYCEEDEF